MKYGLRVTNLEPQTGVFLISGIYNSYPSIKRSKYGTQKYRIGASKKSLNDELKTVTKINLVKSRSFAQCLKIHCEDIINSLDYAYDSDGELPYSVEVGKITG